jgi:hypothetical protein
MIGGMRLQKGEVINMDAKIVIALAKHEDIEDVTSCFEFLSKPGMTAIFLLRYPLEFWPYMRDHWVTTESVRAAVEQGEMNLARYSWKSQQELADHKFVQAREALGKSGVELKVEWYTGSLKTALLKYSADPQVFWIVRPTPTRRLFSPLLSRIIAHFRSLHSTKLIPSWSLFRVAYRREAR